MSVAEDAVDNYLLWELCRQEGIQEMIIEGSAGGKELKEVVEKVRKEYREKDYSLDEKREKLRELDSNPDYRIKIFDNCTWTEKTVKVQNLGTTLPRLGDLPPEIITDTLSEVLEFVKKTDPDKYRSVKYIESLKEVSGVLNEFYPWVITPGKRQSKQDRMNRVHGEKDWDIAETWGVINDGNHRAIASVLASDLEEIECYVGHRKRRG